MSVWTGIGVFNVIASQSMKLFFSLEISTCCSATIPIYKIPYKI